MVAVVVAVARAGIALAACPAHLVKHLLLSSRSASLTAGLRDVGSRRSGRAKPKWMAAMMGWMSLIPLSLSK